MRKTLAMLLAVLLGLSVTACSGTNEGENAQQSETNSESTGSTDVSEQKGMVLDNTATEETANLELPVSGLGRFIETDVKADKPYKIGLIVKNNTNPYMALAADGAKKAAEDMGFEINIQAPATADSVEEQVSIMESMIESGIDAFVTIPVDSNGIVPAVKKADENKIPVAAIGTAPATEIFLRTGADYYPSGTEIAKAMFEKAGGKGGLVIIEGPSGAQNSIERLQGITDVLADYPDIELLASQPANFNRVQGMTVMENLLQQEGMSDKLTMVIGCNSEMAIGAYQAIKAAGLEKQVMIGTFDGFKDDVAMVESGEFYCTYNMDPYSATYLACCYLVQYLNDGTTPDYNFIPFPTAQDGLLITTDNVQEFLDTKASWGD